MNFDEVTLIEIEDYIQALDENVGLKVETIQDIAQAISKQRGLVEKLTIPAVSGRSELLVCVCKNRKDQFKRGNVWICGDCEEEIKQTNCH